MKDKFQNNGIALPIVAVVLLLLLTGVSSSIWLQENNSLKILSKKYTDSLALLLVKTYVDYDCNLIGDLPTPSKMKACNESKYIAAINAGSSFINNLSKSDPFHDFKFACSLAGACPLRMSSKEEKKFEIQFGKYYKTESNDPSQIGCPSGKYPCWKHFNENSFDEFANSVRVKTVFGKNVSKGAFETFFNKLQYQDKIEKQSFATVIPSAGFFISDLSSSIQSGSHVSIPQINQNAHTTIYGLSSNSFINNSARNSNWSGVPPSPHSGIALVPEDFLVQPSFFAYYANNTQEVIEQTDFPYQKRMYWDLNYPTRAGLSVDDYKNPFIHPKDDYGLVEHTSTSKLSYDNYPEREYHVSPEDSPYVLNDPSPEIKDFSMVNFYRAGSIQLQHLSNGPQRGAEPLGAIMRGMNLALHKFIERGNQYYDQYGFMFVGSPKAQGNSWQYTGKLGRNLEYWNSVLDYDNYRSEENYNNLEDVGGGKKGLSRSKNPKWVELQLFPRPGTFTPFNIALLEAVRQLSKVNEDTQKFIVNFSDNLNTCTTKSCESSAKGYNDALDEAKIIINNSLVNTGEFPTKFHNFNVGFAPTGSFLFHGNNDGTACLSDFEARAAKKEIFTYIEGIDQTSWARRLSRSSPLRVVPHWYNFSQATGGVFKHLRLNVSDYQKATDDQINGTNPYIGTMYGSNVCDESFITSVFCNSGSQRESYYNHYPTGGCDTLDEAIESFIDELFLENSHYQLVEEPNLES